MGSSFLDKIEPEIVVEVVLKRAKVGKISRTLQTRLAFAQFKAEWGWEDLSIDAIEPRYDELRRRAKQTSADDSSCSSTSQCISERLYRNSSCSLSSPTDGSALFSDKGLSSSSVCESQSSHRKRSLCPNNFEEAFLEFYSRKRYCCSSPPHSDNNCCSRSPRNNRSAFRDRQLNRSSPIKSRRPEPFTTASDPSLPFYAGPYFNRYACGTLHHGLDDDETYPVLTFNDDSTPPCTPPSMRYRGNFKEKTLAKISDIHPYLTASPSPIGPARKRNSLQTPPSGNLALPSSMMSAPHNGCNIFSKYGEPQTPSQAAFDFSDFVNMTPTSPKSESPRTPCTLRTPVTTDFQLFTFDNIPSPRINDQLSTMGT